MDLQKASMWKRICAWILDLMIVVSLAVGVGMVLSAVTGYDSHYADMEQRMGVYTEQFSKEYGVDLSTTAGYESLDATTKQRWEEANLAMNKAMNADDALLGAYNTVANLSMVITVFSILISMLSLEFVLPLILGNGQTIGKKVFSLGVMRIDSVKVSAMQMFVRALLGKYTIETMIPVFMVLLFIFGAMDITGTIVIIGIVLTQIVMIAVTKNNSTIHDMLSGTVVVDVSSQKIFRSSDELLAYTKKIHAERARRQTY